MRRLTIAVLALGLGLASATGCGDTNEQKCKKAVENIFTLTGLNKSGSGPDVHAAVRSCRANASSDAIDCMIDAKSLDDLAKCEGDFAKGMVEPESGKGK